jgi:tetratricopeptide (TPR) repeat protein
MSTRLVLALSACLLAAGCATAPTPPPAVPERLFVDAAFGPPAQPVDAHSVLALSPAMRHYLEAEIAPLLRQQGRQRGLVEALHRREQLRLEYDAEVTRTAAEAFDARAGNCLSLVVMTAALAKHLELPIQYQVLVGQESWSRSGTLTFVNGHVNISVAKRLVDRIAGSETDGALQLNFDSLPPGRGAALRVVSEATILSLFMNNRAAESLVRGDMAQAYAYAREAVSRDPGHAGGFNTLGVIYRRHGLAGPAERAFAHALSLDPGHRAALDNLALLFESQQRLAEAAPLRAALRRLEAEPPFQQFDLGREALAHGDYAAAKAHFERALKRNPDYHEFHHALAIALAGLGDSRGATQHLTAARDNSVTRQQQAIYAGKLDRLKAPHKDAL